MSYFVLFILGNLKTVSCKKENGLTEFVIISEYYFNQVGGFALIF